MTIGIFFNRSFNEIFAVGLCDDDELPETAGWIKVSDDPHLGLLPVRRLLVEGGLVKDYRLAYWYGFRGSVAGHERPAPLQSSPGADRATARQRRSPLSALTRLGEILRIIFGVRGRYA